MKIKWQDVKELPIGHYDKDAYAAQIKEIYGNIKIIEHDFSETSELPKSLTISEAKHWLGGLCGALCIRKKIRFILNDTQCDERNAAGIYHPHWKNRHGQGWSHVIGFAYNYITMRVLLHEFAHFVCHVERMGVGHDNNYIETLKFVWETAIYLKNKRAA